MSTTSAPGPGPAPGPSATPTITPAKRSYDDAVAALGASTAPTSRKRTKRGTIDTKAPLEKLQSCAKYLVRGISPFLDMGLVMFYGAEALWGAPQTQVPGNEITLSPSQLHIQAVYTKAFKDMLSISPSCLDIVHQFYVAQNDPQWNLLVQTMRAAASSARQSDTNGLKHCTHYVLADPHTQVITPPVAKGALKSDRGINHPMLRKYFIPWELRNRILSSADSEQSSVDAGEGAEETPQSEAEKTLKDIMNGTILINETDYPSCFYAEGTYDPSNRDIGLFRGKFLLRVSILL
ncbi:hypothetical protein C8J57DRAFT_1517760 [Mycena rebaudengoi]|nr:hypothetical protein C8J57DRAFT_1517760 [Mycena rebaudengoi]